MSTEIAMHDVVALLDDTPAEHFSTGEPLLLRRGQIGTVVMAYDEEVFDIEFADPQGSTYALLPLPASRLMRLRDLPEPAAA